MSESRQRIEALLVPVVQELVQAEGGIAGCQPQIPPSGAILATIGFGGLDVNGALVVLAVEPAVRALVTQVFDAVATSERMLCDMVGELSNLLLGRYRAALLREGVEILPATPVTVRAQELDVRSNGAASWHAFTTSAGTFWLCLEASLRPGFSIDEPTQAPVVSNEIDFVLF